MNYINIFMILSINFIITFLIILIILFCKSIDNKSNIKKEIIKIIKEKIK